MYKVRHIKISLLLLTAGAMSWGLIQVSSRSVSRLREQREAIQAIRDAGGRFYYDYVEDSNGVWAGGKSWVPVPAQRILQRSLNSEWRDWIHDVGYVLLEGDRADDQTLAKVSKLSNVRFLVLWSNSRVTERGYAHIGGMKSLTCLSLQHSHLTDAGMRHLTELSQLKQLELNNTLISDNSIDHLRAFSEIEQLYISGTTISKAVGRDFEAEFATGIVDY